MLANEDTYTFIETTQESWEVVILYAILSQPIVCTVAILKFWSLVTKTVLETSCGCIVEIASA